MDLSWKLAETWQQELDDIIERHRENGIILSITPGLSSTKVRTAVFADIFLPAERRGWGEGGGAVRTVMEWADRNNVVLRLTPEHRLAGMNKPRLERFWRGFGFRTASVKDQQGEYTETHIREPATKHMPASAL